MNALIVLLATVIQSNNCTNTLSSDCQQNQEQGSAVLLLNTQQLSLEVVPDVQPVVEEEVVEEVEEEVAKEIPEEVVPDVQPVVEEEVVEEVEEEVAKEIPEEVVPDVQPVVEEEVAEEIPEEVVPDVQPVVEEEVVEEQVLESTQNNQKQIISGLIVAFLVAVLAGFTILAIIKKIVKKHANLTAAENTIVLIA